MTRGRLRDRRWVAVALLVIVLVGGGVRAWYADHPSRHQSTDERAYVKIALDIATNGRYGDPSLHWPPGAPLMFAAAHAIAPHPNLGRSVDIPAAYWAQAVVGTLLIPVVFGIAALIAGAGAGLAAAAVVALYSPLILNTTELLSEPLGALVIALAVLALTWAFRLDGARPRRGLRAGSAGATAAFALGGLLLGGAVLVRTDLLPVPFLAAVLIALLLVRRGGPLRALACAGAVALGAACAIAPWVINASSAAGEFVPVTRGGGPALFVGTFLPGGGSQEGLKRALADEVKAARPELRHIRDRDLMAATLMRHVANRHPELSREDALAREARLNLVRYGLGRPLGFARMMAQKVPAMWLRYSHGRGRATERDLLAIHVAAVLVSVAGLAAGLWRRRQPALAVIALVLAASTALHMLAVAIPRYSLPLMPILIAGGMAGLALARRDRRGGEPVWPPDSGAPGPAEPDAPRAELTPTASG